MENLASTTVSDRPATKKRVRLRLRDERERERLPFVPSWSGPIEGWCVNYVRKNRWRIQSHPANAENDFKDFVQEGWLLFNKCVERYPEVVDPQHFMALFKTTFRNYINDVASARSELRSLQVHALDYDVEATPDLTPGELAEIELKLALADAPSALRALVESLRELPEEALGFLRDPATGIRETSAQRLQRLARSQLPVAELAANFFGLSVPCVV